MVSAAICHHLRPHKHRRILQFSSSSSNSDSNHQHETTQSQSSSYFDDVKSSLRQTSPPTRKPSFLHSNRTAGDSPLRKTDPLEEIRKNLSTFRRSDAQSPPPPSSAPVLSFQELYRRNVLSQSDNLGSTSDEAFNTMPSSLKSIRLSLQNQLSTPSQSKLDFSDLRHNLKFRPEKVPESIVKGKKEVVTDEMKTEFVRTYSYGELGQKLMNLRPEVKRNEKIRFSLVELNERLKKLREVEEKEDKNMNGVMSGLRAGLRSLQISQVENKNRTNAAQRLGVIGQIIGTPNFMLSPPKEVLVEKYFHPDHMSSSEKQKLELQKVRDQFKMSESDCGSSRVQVAQLTTKIKHLASVLHKKDKHSRKGLQAMVQKRKKLLKYLRRTDWDSYCFCLTELGLRDSADYKA